MNPITANIKPLAKLMVTAVCIASLSCCILRPPKYLPTSTFAPTDNPIKRLVNRLIRDDVDPTAASEWSPTNCPSITISVALKSICIILESISGKAKTSIFFNMGPFTISISCFFLFPLSFPVFPPDSLIFSEVFSEVSSTVSPISDTFASLNIFFKHLKYSIIKAYKSHFNIIVHIFFNPTIHCIHSYRHGFFYGISVYSG